MTYYIKPRRLNIIYTFECNARCSHCCYSCSPEKVEKMDFEFAKRLIDDATAIPTISEVSFSGGEIFLHPEEILSLIRYARLKNFSVICNTNGFWGANKEKADRLMKVLRSHNISLLSLSYDYFHSEFVPQTSIINICNLAKKYGVYLNLKCVIGGNQSIFSFLSLLENYLEDVPIVLSNCLKVGRARNFDSYICTRSENIVNFRCDSLMKEITVYPDGTLTPCCAPVIEPYFFSKCNLYDMPLSNSISELAKNERINYVCKYGVPPIDGNALSLCDICKKYFTEL